MHNLTGLTCVIPTYKEDPKVVTKLYCELVMLGAEVIVVNDGDTVELPDDVNQIAYQPNMGYGYALKKGIRSASNEFILTMDSDGEHRVEDAIKLWTVFNLINKCDMLVGCRWNLKEKPIRWIGRKLINFIASCWARHFLVDLNSGMRLFRRKLAIGYEPILCDTFSFTTSFTMALVTDNHKVAWFPIDNLPRAFGKSHVNLIRDGIITVWYIFWVGFALRTRVPRAFLRSLYHV